MHIERLRQAKATLAVTAPRKQSHLSQNLKKELQNLGNEKVTPCSPPLIERQTEIQYENRVLLRKMLRIDIKNKRAH